jgi:hypothetical protein
MTLPVGTDIYISKKIGGIMINESKNFSEVKPVGTNHKGHVRVDDVLKGAKANRKLFLKRLLANPLKRPRLRMLV